MRLPIATTIQSRDGTLTKDSKLVNCMVETAGDSGEVYRRPGTNLSTLGSGDAQGVVCWNNTLYTVSENILSQGPTSEAYPSGAIWSSTGADPVAAMHRGVTSVAHNGYLFVISRTDNLLKRSSDGITFSTVATDPFSYGGETLHFASLGTTLYCLQCHYSGSVKKVWKSVNDGVNWTLVTSTPAWSTRFYPAVFVHDSKIWVIGGQWGTNASSDKFSYDDVWYSSDGNTWTQASASGGFGARSYFNGCSLGGVMYIAGGINIATRKQDVWKSTNNGVTWTQCTATADWTARHSLAVIPFRSKIWAIGGNTGSQVSEVWSSPDGVTWTEKATSIGGSLSDEISATVFNSLMYTIFTNSVFKSTADLTSDYSYTLSTAAGLPISFSSTSGGAATEYLFLKTTGAAWVLTLGTPGTLTSINDADYPTLTVPGAPYLDGYIFVMDPDGVIYNCDLEVPTSWNALNFISAETEPDTAIAIDKHENYIVAFKGHTTEFFYDAANATGSPLSRVANATVQIGCGAGYSPAHVDGYLFFLSKTRAKGISVHAFAPGSMTPTEVATPAIQRVLNAATLTTVRCWAGRIGGHSYYALSLVTEGLTIVFDMQSKVWSQWTWLTAGTPIAISNYTLSDPILMRTGGPAHGYSTGDMVLISGCADIGVNGMHIITVVNSTDYTYPRTSSAVQGGSALMTKYSESYFPFSYFGSCGLVDFVQHETTGALYEISFELDDDDGSPINCLVRSAKFDAGNNERKVMSAVELIGDQIAGEIMLRWSDDDYQTWSEYRRVSLAQENVQVRRLGMFRRRAMDIRFIEAGKFHLTDVEVHAG